MVVEGQILEVRKKLALRIRVLRKKRGWTQQDLADRADIAMRHIQRLESKRPSAIELDSIVKLSRAFKISISDFLSLD